MSRLIDAEPLIEFFEQKRTEWFDLDIGASTAYDIAKQAVEEAETFEAIPFEWISDWGEGTILRTNLTAKEIADGIIRSFKSDIEHGIEMEDFASIRKRLEALENQVGNMFKDADTESDMLAEWQRATEDNIKRLEERLKAIEEKIEGYVFE